MQKDILRTIEYFEIFSFYPDFDQIHTFLSKKVNKKVLKETLNTLVKSKNIIFKAGLYTRGEYKRRSQKSSHFAKSDLASRDKKLKSKMEKQKERGEITRKKVERISQFINLLARVPQIQLIGLSGSAAMNNTNEKDDVDLFIISSKNRIWIARTISLFLASILNIRRHRIEHNPGDKICLNLFFDEKNMETPKNKKNYFTAHEIIQMKPIVSKNNIYFRFLQSNKWVFDMFPNAQYLLRKNMKQKYQKIKQIKIGDYVESLLRKLQLWFINRHKTSEIITDTQLWFFPNDFEKKLPLWARKRYNE